jgi:hypothetical protein
LRIRRNTIRRYLETEELPRYQLRRPRPSAITTYVPHLEARWAEGCHNSRVLWEEIRQQGYPGSYSSVRRFVQRYRSGRRRRSSSPLPGMRPLSTRQAAWLLVLAPGELSAEQRAYLTALGQVCPEIATAYELAQRFVLMVQRRQAD